MTATPLNLAGSSMSGVHRSPVLRPALESIAEWVHARDRLNALAAVELPDEQPAVDLTADLLDRLETGEPVDGVWLLERVGAARSVQEDRDAAARALTLASARVVGELDGAVRYNSAALYGHLNTELGELLAEAGALLSTLGSVRDMEAAAAQEKVEQLSAFRQLEHQYAAIRKAQQTVFKSLQQQLITVPLVAFIADPIAADSEFVARRLGLLVTDLSTGAGRYPGPEPWPDLASADALRWLCAHSEAKPWVPTDSERQAAEERVQDALRRHIESLPDARPGEQVIRIDQGIEEAV